MAAPKTLSQILISVNAYVDLDASEPTGTELTVRANYAGQAVEEWAAASNWSQLTEVYQPSVSSLASISLPTNFREFSAPPAVLQENGVWDTYVEIKPKERYGKNSSDKYCYLLGNSAGGMTAVFNNLTAGATLSIDYQRHPSSMATLSDKCECSDPEYVKLKVISYVLQSRGDDRFPTVDANANRFLQNMIGRESRLPPGGVNQVRRTGSAAYSIGSSRGSN